MWLASILQERGDLFVSLDGNFGLVHKQNSGNSHEPPQVAGSVFLEQSKLDDFVKTYDTSTKVGEGVRPFLKYRYSVLLYCII